MLTYKDGRPADRATAVHDIRSREGTTPAPGKRNVTDAAIRKALSKPGASRTSHSSRSAAIPPD